MAVGTEAIGCYQGEDVSWTFTVTDSNVASIAGWDIELVIKATAAAADPPLIGPTTASITGTLTCLIEDNIDVDPGTYVYSLRRVDTGFSWQLAHGVLTVTDSASIDT